MTAKTVRSGVYGGTKTTTMKRKDMLVQNSHRALFHCVAVQILTDMFDLHKTTIVYQVRCFCSFQRNKTEFE